MAVVTISREFGCRGDQIAQQVAQALGYHLVDKEFMAAVLDQYGLVEFDHEYNALPGFWERFIAQRLQHREVIVDMLNRVVRTVAYHGNVVILGRSGFAILRGLRDVLHVRVQAPFPDRVAQVAAEQQLALPQAEALVREQDKARAAFVEEFYNVPWGTSSHFDLVINTGKIAPELATQWVIDATRALAVGPAAGGPTTDSIAVDSVLAAAIVDKLACSVPRHSA